MPVVLDQAIDLAMTGMRRVAVVGASANPFRASNSVVETLLDRGFEVVPVNPTLDEVHGLRCWPDLASVPGRIDVVDVFRREEHLPGVAREAVARDDVAVVWNQLGLRSPEARAIVLGAGRGYVEHACLEATIGRRGLRAPAAARLEHPVVLLDLDDTILDHDACERSAAAATLAAFDLPADDEAVDVYVRENAALWRAYEQGLLSATVLRVERWERTLAALGGEAATADVDAVSRDYLERFSRTGTLLPGAAEAVWWLARRARVGVATNGFLDVQAQRLAAAGLADVVHAFASSEEAGAAKPDPAVLRLALGRLGVDGQVAPEEVAVVGDKLATDVAAGAAIGATTVWVANPAVGHGDGAPDADDVARTSVVEPDVRVRALAELA